MQPFEKHVFVCENERAADHPRGCCASKDAAKVRALLKKAVVDAGLKGRVRINKAGCLDQCEDGLTIVVYPETVWYGGVTVDDVDEIFNEHIVGGRPVERLRIDRADR